MATGPSEKQREDPLGEDARAARFGGWFWLALVALSLGVYGLCLRFLFPGYFAPLSPFHIDFYEYVGAAEKSFAQLAAHYPRPVSYMAMKILAAAGLRGFMAGAVALTIVNLLLTVALAARLLRCRSRWTLGIAAVYFLLLFAHPEFYFEHRHDFPLEVSAFFLLLALLAWTSWVDDGAGRPSRPAWQLAAAILCAGLFAFAKETYFLSAACLLLGLAIASRPHRKQHLGFLAVVVAFEALSVAWTRHVNSPFVNAGAGASSAYHVNLAPGSIAETYWFYLAHLFGPALAVLVAWSIAATWRDRHRFWLALSLAAAGLAALVPHAVLPNHKFEEYAWAAAPWLLAPILALGETSRRRLPARMAALAALAIAAIAAPMGYLSQYNSDVLRWMVNEDKTSGALADSLPAFAALHRPARVLVAGLDDPSVPWQNYDFVRFEFGAGLHWTVLLPPSAELRRSNRLVAFAAPAGIDLANFDYLARYRSGGRLVAIRPVSDIPANASLPELLVPGLEAREKQLRRNPEDAFRYLDCAAVAIDWGLWPEAKRWLDRAAARGAGDDPAFQRLSAALRNRPAQAPAQPVGLAARPAHILQPNGSGAGSTDLYWTVPDGMVFEIHVSAPNGPLFSAGDKSGHARAEGWVTNGMQFFLQDVSGGKPLSAEHTLASVKVEVTR
ncbi:MAG: hypothetical protein ACLQVN_08060 [Bryobacteraceae bacterium]